MMVLPQTDSTYILPKNNTAGVLKETTVNVQPATSGETNIYILSAIVSMTSLGISRMWLSQDSQHLPVPETGRDVRWDYVSLYLGSFRNIPLEWPPRQSLCGHVCPQKKRVKLLQDCPVLITLVCTGSVGGTISPTIFLLSQETH